MAWSSPRVWSVGETLTAANFNTYISDDLTYLFDNSVKSGHVVAYGANIAPTGWLLCNGAVISRTTYAALFAITGTLFGAGDGSTTFSLPNTKGRALHATWAGDAAFLTVGQTGGAKTVTLVEEHLVSHSHTKVSDSHTHGGDYATYPGGTDSGKRYRSVGADYFVNHLGLTTVSGVGISTQSTGSGTAHLLLQPYITSYFIIKT